jgi:hypothetical protein
LAGCFAVVLVGALFAGATLDITFLLFGLLDSVVFVVVLLGVASLVCFATTGAVLFFLLFFTPSLLSLLMTFDLEEIFLLLSLLAMRTTVLVEGTRPLSDLVIGNRNNWLIKTRC